MNETLRWHDTCRPGYCKYNSIQCAECGNCTSPIDRYMGHTKDCSVRASIDCAFVIAAERAIERAIMIKGPIL